ncbi:hypothetical protein HID58_092043 [Brassica napus]|uniref:V-ATPase proteolipid subunit C-like domain-containing protein n=1 Tax=Brassica napus TaxID=3708 RepID=A0ABQ7WZW9_BRANA|nr:hypothetical protein HID58_092043 [Brassica napus]
MRRSLSQQLMLPSMNSTLRSVNGAVRMLKGLCLLSKGEYFRSSAMRDSPCGLAGLSAGMAIGIVGDAGSECTTTKALYGMILILIFAEALSLYGLIVGIILSSRAGQARVERTLKVS